MRHRWQQPTGLRMVIDDAMNLPIYSTIHSVDRSRVVWGNLWGILVWVVPLWADSL